MLQFHPSAAGFRARRFFLHLLLALAAGTAAARAAEMSELAPLAPKSLLLAVARAGDKLVAVGDRGHLLLSADQGRTWTQSRTPTRAMLTGVAFPDAQHGWAVGHDGVILATSDGGLTWVRQDDGKDLETVYLSVLFRDATHGFAVGAYGKFIMTSDGGKNWTAAKPAEEEVHYNRISEGTDGWLYLAGESGTLLVSQDGGKNWTKAKVPYEGSLFGALPLEIGRVVVYGLRGHILRSEDHGADWEPTNSTVKVLIMGGTRLASGPVVLAGQGGNFFVSRDGGRTFNDWKPADFGTSVADVIDAGDGTLLTVGEAGAVRVTLP
ncbi:MAG TPA: YCF48-related protein [Lacunisphaera sp.]|nr:YCF48-related protein [Lacunisphaera sp.]